MIKYEKIEYYDGILEKYKANPNLNNWADDFLQVMLGLWFGLEAEEPYKIAEKLVLKLKEV